MAGSCRTALPDDAVVSKLRRRTARRWAEPCPGEIGLRSGRLGATMAG
jgi:hypothetical protein